MSTARNPIIAASKVITAQRGPLTTYDKLTHAITIKIAILLIIIFIIEISYLIAYN